MIQALLVALLVVVPALGQKCHDGICDIMIVVDRSGSIGKIKPNGDRQERHFVEDLIKLQFEKYADPKVGLVLYSTKAELDQELTGNQKKLHDDVENWKGVGGWTRTNYGIKTARVEMDDHARTDCRKMYVITDGKAKYKKQDLSRAAIREANAARKKGIEVYAIGVGAGADRKELEGIADPGPNHLWMVDSFDQADDAIVKNDVCLQKAACTVKPVHVEGGSWSCNPPVQHDGTCSLICDHQKVAGNGRATCKNGLWTDYNDEKCSAATCDQAPIPIKDGVWDCAPGLPKQSLETCELKCNFGVLAGDGLATCRDGKWVGTDDDVCEPPTCPKRTFAYAGSTYKFTSTPMSWNMAQAEAVSLGGFLLSVSTEAEQNYIKNQVFKSQEIRDREYWMGVFADQKNDGWQWASKADFGYTNWEPGSGSIKADQYGLINDEYVKIKRANHLAKWSTVGNHDLDVCGLVEIPPKLHCQCNTVPQDKTCAPQECSTLRSDNVWSLVMCRFDMQAEFGNNWKETKPNQFVSDLGPGFTCSPATSAHASLCP